MGGQREIVDISRPVSIEEARHAREIQFHAPGHSARPTRQWQNLRCIRSRRVSHAFSSEVPNTHKDRFLADLSARVGVVTKLQGSLSLFSIGTDIRVYVRYSKLHDGGRAFFGLRDIDLRKLEGRNSYICFILDDDSPSSFCSVCRF